MPPPPPPIPYERRHPMLIRNRIWLTIGATLFVLLTMLTWILPLLLSGGGDEDDDFRTTNDPFPEVVLEVVRGSGA
jgi:hypothetical protein